MLRVGVLKSSCCYDLFGKMVLGHVKGALVVSVHFNAEIVTELAFDFHFECVSLGMSRNFRYKTVESFLDLFVQLGEEDTVIAVDGEEYVIA